MKKKKWTFNNKLKRENLSKKGKLKKLNSEDGWL